MNYCIALINATSLNCLNRVILLPLRVLNCQNKLLYPSWKPDIIIKTFMCETTLNR